MDGKRKLRIAHRNRLFSRRRMPAIPSRCRWTRASSGTEHRAMPTRIAHAPSATGYQAGAASMTPIDPSRSPAHTSSDPPAAPKIAMPMSTCLRNARGRRTDTTATATSAAPFAKRTQLSNEGKLRVVQRKQMHVQRPTAQRQQRQRKALRKREQARLRRATPSPFCSRDLNMPVL